MKQAEKLQEDIDEKAKIEDLKAMQYLVVGESGSAHTSLSAEETGFKLRREASTGKLAKWWRFFVKSTLGTLEGLDKELSMFIKLIV
jgi:hypothetical protein